MRNMRIAKHYHDQVDKYCLATLVLGTPFPRLGLVRGAAEIRPTLILGRLAASFVLECSSLIFGFSLLNRNLVDDEAFL